MDFVSGGVGLRQAQLSETLLELVEPRYLTLGPHDFNLLTQRAR